MLKFSDVMLAVGDMEAAAEALAGLLGFVVVERAEHWIGLAHPAGGARLVLVERDFGADWAVACEAKSLPEDDLFRRYGVTPPELQQLRDAGHCLLRSDSGLNLLLYG